MEERRIGSNFISKVSGQGEEARVEEELAIEIREVKRTNG